MLAVPACLFFFLLLPHTSHALSPIDTNAAAVPIVLAKPSSAGVHQDSRCMCRCPDVSTVRQSSPDEDGLLRAFAQTGGGEVGRSVYVNSSTTPADCDCGHVVLPHLNLTAAEADSFCQRCQCKFQSRNLSIIKVVVILVLWVISILVIYMAFLACLEPILSRRQRQRRQMNYREQHDDVLTETEEEEDAATTEDDEAAGAAAAGSNATPMRAYGSRVIHRVGDQTNRWKKQVKEQRKNIYDRHSMLN